MKKKFTKHIKVVDKPRLPKHIDNELRDPTFYKLIRNYPEPSIIYKIVTKNKVVLFLKVGNKLRTEYKKLQWLQNKINVPNVLNFSTLNTTDYMLMSEVRGIAGDDSVWKQNQTYLIDRLIESMSILMEVDISNCPFHSDWREQKNKAKTNMEKLVSNTNDCKFIYQYQLLEKYFKHKTIIVPDRKDLVFSHGDLCLPNILLDSDKTSFVDLGSSCISDKYRDLALLSRSIFLNYGTDLEQNFFSRFGKNIDYEKIEYYRLLDRFGFNSKLEMH